MKFVAAYLLAVLGGNQKPSADDVNAILAAAGAQTDEAKVKLLIERLQGRSAYELIEEGKGLMATLGGCGAAAGGSSGAAAGAAAAGNDGADGKKEEEQEKKKEEEEEEEEDGDFGLDLFG